MVSGKDRRVGNAEGRAAWRAGNAAPVTAEWVRFWRGRGRGFLREASTPAFLFAAEPLARQRARLAEAFAGLPVRHWWSFKTLPLGAAVDWWRRQGEGVEVVSEFEWRAVRRLGFPADRILVNGPAKHAWLPTVAERGMRVTFDSVAEVRALAPMARRFGWRVGVRVGTGTELNGEHPGVRAQFGLSPGEVAAAARSLARAGLAVDWVHFHLRTNVPEARCYAEGAEEAMTVACAVGWRPGILDLGGGFPVERVASRKGAPLDAGFSLAAMRDVLAAVVRRHGLEELWLENGRWLTAPAGVLLIRVLDEKTGRGVRTLICDGGRTMNAMVATWERHVVAPLAARRGASVPTLLCGPTCMAFDNLGIHDLPRSVRIGDVLLWFDAGAYQTGWETGFSHGLAAMGWVEGSRYRAVRGTEPFRAWMGRR